MVKVAIIGRANVGKSTLFNRLAEKRRAMVSNIPGTTRDLKYADIEWQGKKFELVDTGGFLAEQKKPLRDLTKKEQKKFKKQTGDDIDKQVESQARLALSQAEVVLMVVDTKEGLNPQDKEIANYLRKTNKQVILAANKCDSQKVRPGAAEFNKLGLGEPAMVSAANGSGTGDLLDLIVKRTAGLNKDKEDREKKNSEHQIKVSIIGKPNAGKSSLLNSILGEDKAIVSPIPHTTREPNDTLIEYEGNNILLIDTAGIRRKAKVEGGLEKLGVSMSIKSLKKSDVVLLVTDMSENISKQDLKIGELIAEAGVSAIIVVNKYDLVKPLRQTSSDPKDESANIETLKQTSVFIDEGAEEESRTITKEYKQYLYNHFPHLDWAPIIFISAKTGWNVKKILKLILEVEKEKDIRISDSVLNKFLKSIIKRQPPPRKREGDGRKMKIKRAFITKFRQIDTNPPTFECTIDTKEKLPESYRKYIINQMRNKFGFKGVPIKLVIRKNRE